MLLNYKKEDFKFYKEFDVHFDECDLEGIVHNSNYIKYFERGRVAYFKNLGLSWSKQDLGEDFFVVVGENYCKYKATATCPNTLRIYVRIGQLKSKTCRFEYVIHRPQDDKLICEGYTTIIRVNEEFSKATTFTEKYEKLIEDFEKFKSCN